MSSERETSISEKAWQDFVGVLASAAETICGPTGAISAQERAEGFRYITRLIHAGLDMHLENASSERPAFTQMLTPTQKFLGDNPDTHYDYVNLDGARTYTVRGTRGTSPYLAFCTYGRNAEGNTIIGANLADTEMKIEDDGSFEVVLSATKPPAAGNWLEITPETSSMIVRQYFFDRGSETPASYTLEVSPSPSPLAPYSEEELAERLAAVSHFVSETSELSATLSVLAALNAVRGDATEEHEALQITGGELQAAERPSAQELASQIDPKVIAGHLPTPDIQYTGAWWALQPGEAVVVEGPAPRARYWSVQTFNRWLESPDYRNLQVALNSEQIQTEADGSFRVVLAPENPGVANWIDTAGYSEGQICCRALMSEEPLAIKFRVVKISEL